MLFTWQQEEQKNRIGELTWKFISLEIIFVFKPTFVRRGRRELRLTPSGQNREACGQESGVAVPEIAKLPKWRTLSHHRVFSLVLLFP